MILLALKIPILFAYVNVLNGAFIVSFVFCIECTPCFSNSTFGLQLTLFSIENYKVQSLHYNHQIDEWIRKPLYTILCYNQCFLSFVVKFEFFTLHLTY